LSTTFAIRDADGRWPDGCSAGPWLRAFGLASLDALVAGQM
jgi:hypothetical protein